MKGDGGVRELPDSAAGGAWYFNRTRGSFAVIDHLDAAADGAGSLVGVEQGYANRLRRDHRMADLHFARQREEIDGAQWVQALNVENEGVALAGPCGGEWRWIGAGQVGTGCEE